MHRAFLRTLAAAALLVAAGPAPFADAADTAPRQWYLGAMGADAIGKVSTGEGIKVAVIGTGVNPETPDSGLDGGGQRVVGIGEFVVADRWHPDRNDLHAGGEALDPAAAPRAGDE
ncbi:S8/S53 family peptidase [Streptomyces achromogenes]|uniref:hypothetical protein n=1 Tax=Streptomyces achromogenes TaxID=67255 RepID=UPI0037143A15